MERKYLSISGQMQEHVIHIESQIENIDNEIKMQISERLSNETRLPKRVKCTIV